MFIQCPDCKGRKALTCSCPHCKGHPCAACQGRGYFVADAGRPLPMVSNAQVDRAQAVLRKLGVIS